MSSKAKLQSTPYEDELVARREAYAKHIEEMSIDSAIKAWAERMATANESPMVKVWHNTLPWVEALLVVRYGEDVTSWPKATSIADWGRALDWENGKEIPHAVAKASELSIT